MEGLVEELLCLKKTSGGGGLQYVGGRFVLKSIHKGNIKHITCHFCLYFRLLTACSQATVN